MKWKEGPPERLRSSSRKSSATRSGNRRNFSKESVKTNCFVSEVQRQQRKDRSMAMLGFSSDKAFSIEPGFQESIAERAKRSSRSCACKKPGRLIRSKTARTTSKKLRQPKYYDDTEGLFGPNKFLDTKLLGFPRPAGETPSISSDRVLRDRRPASKKQRISPKQGANTVSVGHRQKRKGRPRKNRSTVAKQRPASVRNQPLTQDEPPKRHKSRACSANRRAAERKNPKREHINKNNVIEMANPLTNTAAIRSEASIKKVQERQREKINNYCSPCMSGPSTSSEYSQESSSMRETRNNSKASKNRAENDQKVLDPQPTLPPQNRNICLKIRRTETGYSIESTELINEEPEVRTTRSQTKKQTEKAAKSLENPKAAKVGKKSHKKKRARLMAQTEDANCFVENINEGCHRDFSGISQDGNAPGETENLDDITYPDQEMDDALTGSELHEQSLFSDYMESKPSTSRRFPYDEDFLRVMDDQIQTEEENCVTCKQTPRSPTEKSTYIRENAGKARLLYGGPRVVAREPEKSNSLRIDKRRRSTELSVEVDYLHMLPYPSAYSAPEAKVPKNFFARDDIATTSAGFPSAPTPDILAMVCGPEDNKGGIPAWDLMDESDNGGISEVVEVHDQSASPLHQDAEVQEEPEFEPEYGIDSAVEPLLENEVEAATQSEPELETGQERENEFMPAREPEVRREPEVVSGSQVDPEPEAGPQPGIQPHPESESELGHVSSTGKSTRRVVTPPFPPANDQKSSSSESNDNATSSAKSKVYRGCRRCRNHGTEIRYHPKEKCPHGTCTCPQCSKIKPRRSLHRVTAAKLLQAFERACREHRMDEDEESEVSDDQILPAFQELLRNFFDIFDRRKKESAHPQTSKNTQEKNGENLNSSSEETAARSLLFLSRFDGTGYDQKPIKFNFEARRAFTQTMIELIDLVSDDEDGDEQEEEETVSEPTPSLTPQTSTLEVVTSGCEPTLDSINASVVYASSHVAGICPSSSPAVPVTSMVNCPQQLQNMTVNSIVHMANSQFFQYQSINNTSFYPSQCYAPLVNSTQPQITYSFSNSEDLGESTEAIRRTSDEEIVCEADAWDNGDFSPSY